MTKRRLTTPVRIGVTEVGGDNPIRIQSMTNTSTLDTEASVAQCLRIAAAGADIVRLTAQGVSQARNLGEIRRRLREAGCDIPLVADIHFNPAAAFAAAEEVEKVRINPGNFVDPGRTFRQLSYTDEQYAAELERLRDKFVPFIALCKEKSTAMRIGVNHGSLSDRIMSRFGDGAEGMVESALEYLRICRDCGFSDVVVSIKASDVPVMTDTVRLLAERMEAEDMAFPLHLGVTEAGNALEGRIKSAVGIGSLLLDGIGDTIRVSLSEPPENEVPVARMIVDHCMEALAAGDGPDRSRSKGRRPSTQSATGIGGLADTVIIGDGISLEDVRRAGDLHIVEATGPSAVSDIRRRIDSLTDDKPVVALISYPCITDRDLLTVKAAVDFGSLLLAGYRDAIAIDAPALTDAERTTLARNIVQAAGLARYQAEIVACPGCGRTLFGLPEALEKVKSACLHLKHLKIAVMGCIVNGPGEMAGADYGYVGAAAGNVSIYRGTECVIKNIPQGEALDALTDLIKADGKWIEKGEDR